jgi:hypothetical protein
MVLVFSLTDSSNLDHNLWYSGMTKSLRVFASTIRRLRKLFILTQKGDWLQ